MRHFGVLRSHENLPHETVNCISLSLCAYVELTFGLPDDPTRPLEVVRPPGHPPPPRPPLRISTLSRTLWVQNTEGLFNCAICPLSENHRRHLATRENNGNRNAMYLYSCLSDRWAQRAQATHRHAGMVLIPQVLILIRTLLQLISGYLRAKLVDGPSLLAILVCRVVTSTTLASRKLSVFHWTTSSFRGWTWGNVHNYSSCNELGGWMSTTCHVQASDQSLSRRSSFKAYRSIGRVSESCSTEQFLQLFFATDNNGGCRYFN